MKPIHLLCLVAFISTPVRAADSPWIDLPSIRLDNQLAACLQFTPLKVDRKGKAARLSAEAKVLTLPRLCHCRSGKLSVRSIEQMADGKQIERSFGTVQAPVREKQVMKIELPLASDAGVPLQGKLTLTLGCGDPQDGSGYH